MARAARHRAAGGEPGRGRIARGAAPADRDALERPVEAVADARHRDDARRVRRPERRAQLGRGVGEHGVAGGAVVPHGVEDALLAHHLAGRREQQRQQHQRLVLQHGRAARDAQLEPRFVELGLPEAEAVQGGGHRARLFGMRRRARDRVCQSAKRGSARRSEDSVMCGRGLAAALAM
ncbi:MAG: hypothetical protein U1F07_17615 [Rubrivivax sp.]